MDIVPKGAHEHNNGCRRGRQEHYAKWSTRHTNVSNCVKMYSLEAQQEQGGGRTTFFVVYNYGELAPMDLSVEHTLPNQNQCLRLHSAE